MNDTTVDQIKDMLNARVREVCQRWAPDGKESKGVWKCKTGRFINLDVELSGENIGMCNDWQSKFSGNLLHLIQYAEGIDAKDWRPVLKIAKDFLNISDASQESYKVIKAERAYKKPSESFAGKFRADSGVYDYLHLDRKISEETISLYRVGESYRSGVWYVAFPYFANRELANQKYRSADTKKLFSQDGGKQILYGWQTIKPEDTIVVITEGELDAMSMRDYGYAALSLPGGAGSTTWIEHDYERLQQFKEIYLCLDNDSAGEDGLKVMLNRLSDFPLNIIKLPCKDANECLQKGIEKHVIEMAFCSAEAITPAQICDMGTYKDALDEYYDPSKKNAGYKLPFSEWNQVMAMRPTEVTILTGYAGHGKTELLGQIMIHAIEQGAAPMIASFELSESKLIGRLSQQATARKFLNKEERALFLKWISHNLLDYKVRGTAKAKEMIKSFEYCNKRYGTDLFIVDSFLKLDAGEESLDSQKDVINELVDFAMRTNSHLLLVAHPRKPSSKSGPNEPPDIFDVRGSSAIVDCADNVLCLWRNLEKEANARAKRIELNQSFSENYFQSSDRGYAERAVVEEEADAILTLAKNRHGEGLDALELFFDRNSRQFRQDYLSLPAVYCDLKE